MVNIQPLAERLKFLLDRQHHGNLAAFARETGLGRTTLHGYINSGRKPDAEALTKIRDATGCSFEWLLTGKGPAPGEGGQSGGRSFGGAGATPVAGDNLAEYKAKAETPHVDVGILTDVLKVLDSFLEEKSVTLSTEKHAEVVALLYDMIAEEEGREIKPDTLAQIVSIAGGSGKGG